MNEENREEIKTGDVWASQLICKCPYCGKEKETIWDSGEEENCISCGKVFILGDL